MPAGAHYRLADYLWQRAAEFRWPSEVGEDTVFPAVLDHATPEELVFMTGSTPRQVAYYTGLRGQGPSQAGRALAWFTARLARWWGSMWSIQEYVRAKKAGSFWAAMCWAQVLSEVDHEPDILLDALTEARARGRLDEALEWIDDVFASGHPDARHYLEAGARQLVYDERLDEAGVAYRRLGPPLDLPYYLWWVVSALAKRGDPEAAYEALRPHLEIADSSSLWLAEHLGLPGSG